MKRQSFLACGAGALLAGCAGTAVPPGAPIAAGAQPAAQGSREPGGQLLGSLLLVPYNFAPAGFAACNGALVAISVNQPLFSLLYNRFGGDGKTKFGLPDLRKRAPIGGLSYVIATEGFFPGRKLRESGAIAPLLGQLLLVPYLPKFVPPPGWAACEGQDLQIRDHEELYSVIGSEFGGDNVKTFALPDLRGHEPAKDLTYVIALKGRYPYRY